MNNNNIQLFENKRIHTAWDEEEQEWYLSVVDVVAILSDSENPQVYWRVLKKRLLSEGNETVTNCKQLKMTAADGKKCLTDVANTEQLLRIIHQFPPQKLSHLRCGWHRSNGGGIKFLINIFDKGQII